MSYKVKVNTTYEFDLSSETENLADIVKTSHLKYHLLHNNQSVAAKILDSDFNTKQYNVEINGNIYAVSIADELDQMITKMGFSVGASKMVNAIKAPMPGLILDIMVKVGQEVKENDNLLILEAMKMENVISSPRDGIIKSVSVNKADTVEKNQLLLEFE